METIQFASLVGLMCVIVAMVAVVTDHAGLQRLKRSGWGGAVHRVLVRLI